MTDKINSHLESESESKTSKNSQRKKPKQSRSRHLVEAILTAAARVLEKSGFSKSTTNKIAELAGVSIGSLYQYFPNKESLIASLIDHEFDRHLTKMEQELKTTEHEPLEGRIDFLVDSVARVFMSRRPFLNALFYQIPTLGKFEETVATRARAVEMIKNTLRIHEKEFEGKNLTTLSFVLVNSVMGVVEYYLMASSEDLPELEAIKSELRLLLRGYLL